MHLQIKSIRVEIFSSIIFYFEPDFSCVVCVFVQIYWKSVVKLWHKLYDLFWMLYNIRLQFNNEPYV